MVYLVKYTVYFVQQDTSVNDEIEVEENTVFFDIEEQKEIKVNSEENAKKYVHSLYSDNEDNVVIIPQSIWDSEDGLTDSELTIFSVDII